jgi:hypothetical protein
MHFYLSCVLCICAQKAIAKYQQQENLLHVHDQVNVTRQGAFQKQHFQRNKSFINMQAAFSFCKAVKRKIYVITCHLTTLAILPVSRKDPVGYIMFNSPGDRNWMVTRRHLGRCVATEFTSRATKRKIDQDNKVVTAIVACDLQNF